MSRKLIFYLGFFVLLVAGFFIGLAKALPGFLEPSFPPIGTVQPFAFVNQDKKIITEKDLQNKVVAVNFFFTTCKTVCPRMNNNLLTVYRKFEKEPDFMILSHTSDPERDSTPVLKQYLTTLGVDPARWMFLTGRKDSLYMAARHSYHIDDPKNYVQRIEDDFLHTQLIALLNRKGEVVKIYDGLKPSEMREMEKDIDRLLKK